MKVGDVVTARWRTYRPSPAVWDVGDWCIWNSASKESVQTVDDAHRRGWWEEWRDPDDTDARWVGAVLATHGPHDRHPPVSVSVLWGDSVETLEMVDSHLAVVGPDTPQASGDTLHPP
jgi:hypothetical protein